jgi:predicted PurR-regulated permease PerM
MENPDRPTSGFALARRSLPLIALGAAVVIFVVLTWYLIDVVLLAFAGLLLAILLRTPTSWIARHTRIGETGALVIVVFLVLALLGGIGWMFGHVLTQQFTTLAERLPTIVANFRDRLAEYNWLIGEVKPSDWFSGKSSTLGRGISAVVATFGALGNLVIVLFTGLFFALQPRHYIHGMLELVPLAQRPRATEVTDAIGVTLRRWVVSQVILMVTIGVMVGLGLWLLGVPFAFALALIAGLLEFIPYVGPILSAVPALLVALAETPELALYVLMLYIGVQSIEGYVLQPLIQERAVYLPPAVLLLAQLVLGILVGALGVMLATPMTAAVFVMIRMLYVQDVLGEPAAEPKVPS